MKQGTNPNKVVKIHANHLTELKLQKGNTKLGQETNVKGSLKIVNAITSKIKKRCPVYPYCSKHNGATV